MTIRVEAIYENGILRPLERLALYNDERVTLIIEPFDDNLDHEYLAQVRAEVAKRGNPPPPTIEEMQERLKDVPGSFADLIVEQRGHR